MNTVWAINDDEQFRGGKNTGNKACTFVYLKLEISLLVGTLIEWLSVKKEVN